MKTLWLVVSGNHEGKLWDFNLALVVVAVVICVFMLLFNVYLLVNYQHPDDKNQAYFPKFIVVFCLSNTVISILMLLADVANQQAYRHFIYTGFSNFMLPIKTLWLLVCTTGVVLVFFFVSFAMFYYEGDQDMYFPPCLTSISASSSNFVAQKMAHTHFFLHWIFGKRLLSALLWVGISVVVCGLALGILYKPSIPRPPIPSLSMPPAPAIILLTTFFPTSAQVPLEHVDLSALADRLYELLAPKLISLLETTLAPLLTYVKELSSKLSSFTPSQAITSFGCLDSVLPESRQGEMPSEVVVVPESAPAFAMDSRACSLYDSANTIAKKRKARSKAMMSVPPAQAKDSNDIPYYILHDCPISEPWMQYSKN
ncbi:LIMR family protein [Platanthera zijinensis]|uniref:LIMR family protein n=1 Tax=Platanthera zijinensis TaxID=2320716 RepID=A0AAP0GAT4_9ASPA